MNAGKSILFQVLISNKELKVTHLIKISKVIYIKEIMDFKDSKKILA